MNYAIESNEERNCTAALGQNWIQMIRLHEREGERDTQTQKEKEKEKERERESLHALRLQYLWLFFACRALNFSRKAKTSAQRGVHWVGGAGGCICIYI